MGLIMNIMIDQMLLENINKSEIKTSINLLSISEMSSGTEYIDCNFLFECIYEEHEFSDMSFSIENCLELYSKEEICSTIIENNKMKKIWNYKAKIRILNYTKHIPYNQIYLVINMVLNDFYCDNNLGYDINIVNDKIINNNFSNKLIDDMYTIISNNQCNVTYIWKYNLFNFEHIIKYMILPTFLTILLQMTHRLKVDSRVDYLGIVATFLLSDIALLFTIPDTSSLIASEKLIYLNIFFKIFIGTFAFYDLDITFGEEIFPWLTHHGIDTFIIILFGLISLFLSLSTMFYAFKEHTYVESILKKYEENKEKVIWDLESFCTRNKIDDFNYTKMKFCRTIYNDVKNYVCS